MGEQGTPSGVVLTLCLYGCFLAGCGYYGAWSRGMDPKAMHSLYMGAGGGAAMVVCGLLTSRSSTYAAVECVACCRSRRCSCVGSNCKMDHLVLADSRHRKQLVHNAGTLTRFFVPGTRRTLAAIGVHVGLVLTMLFSAVFAIQAHKANNDPAKQDRVQLFVVMGTGSITALVALLLQKPKKQEKKAL